MAVLWAQTQLPEITIASQSLLKTRFRNASQLGKGSPLISALGVVDVFVEVSRAYAPSI